MASFTKPGLSHHTTLGGTGISIDRTDQGSLLIGDGTGFNLNTLTGGTGVAITNGSGTIQISSTSSATVSSVNLSAPSEITVTGVPITSSGTIALSWTSQVANKIFASPNASPGIPGFRSLVTTDIPNLDTSKLTTGQLLTTRGGTGLDASAAANGGLLIGTGTGLALATLTAGAGISIINASGGITIASVALVDTITFVISGGGNTVATGIVGDLLVPFACTINQVTLLADQTTNAVIDIWKQTYASFPPTVTQKITDSTPPTLIAVIKSQDSTLSGWTTSIAAGEILRFNVNSCSAATLITISLKVTRS